MTEPSKPSASATETGSRSGAGSSGTDGPRVLASAFVLDRELRYVAFTAQHAEAMSAMSGFAVARGQSFLDGWPNDEVRARIERQLRLALGGTTLTVDVPRSGPDDRDVRLTISPVPGEDGPTGLMVVVEGTTGRWLADAYQSRLNRELRAITRCNEVLIRATEEQALLDDICRIVCEEAGYRMAWVGYLETDEAHTVRPVASTGASDGELEEAAVTWADEPRGRGPTGTAARTGRVSNIQNFQTDPLAEPWRGGAQRYGYRAAVGLPLKDQDGTTFGVLSICTASESFNAEEIHLLTELAGNLAFGINAIRARIAHRSLEAHLRQVQKIEVIGQLAGGVAHDFNNLLTAIRGYTELAAAGLTAAQAQEREDLGEVLAAVERAEVMTRGLLAFGRRQVVQPRTVVAADLIERLLPMLRRLLGEHVELDTSFSRRDAVRADPTQLEQVVLNLVVNARDAMPAGGRIGISTDIEDLDAAAAAAQPGSAAGRYLVLSVTDHGTGMDAATQAHLFEPFFTTKDEGKGTGLGLATVYGIVRQAGGFITVTSSLGHGSQFRVHLPEVAMSDESGAEIVATAPVPSGTGVVLLVEDDPAVRDFASRALRQLGYFVLEASSGAEAIELAAATPSPIDLMVTDTVMAGMQGPEVARRMREMRPGTRCLFTSGYIDPSSAAAMADGLAPFLPKPYSIEQLAVAIRAAMES